MGKAHTRGFSGSTSAIRTSATGGSTLPAMPAMAAALTGPVGTQMLMANLCALALMMVTLWPAGKSAATIKVNCLMWSGFAFFWSLVIIPYNIKTGQMTGDKVIPYHVFNLGSGAACLYAFATMTEEKAKK